MSWWSEKSLLRHQTWFVISTRHFITRQLTDESSVFEKYEYVALLFHSYLKSMGNVCFFKNYYALYLLYDIILFENLFDCIC